VGGGWEALSWHRNVVTYDDVVDDGVDVARESNCHKPEMKRQDQIKMGRGGEGRQYTARRTNGDIRRVPFVAHQSPLVTLQPMALEYVPGTCCLSLTAAFFLNQPWISLSTRLAIETYLHLCLRATSGDRARE